MAHEETVMELMNQLVIADKHIIGDLMAHKELWTAGTSAVNNSYKALNILVDAGRLERGDGYFRLLGCKSEYKEHSRLLSKAIAEIHKLNLQAKIKREVSLNQIGLRLDALILLTRGNQNLFFCLEICNHESETYLLSKIHALKNWDGVLFFFSQLFETKSIIKTFDIVISGDLSPEGTFNFQNYIEKIKEVK